MASGFNCVSCASCCKKYWITLLPKEAKAVAKLLGLSFSGFLKKHCTLILQAFPFRHSGKKNPLVVSAESLPKNLQKNLLEKSKSKRFLLLPSVAFKRSKGTCIMLSKEFSCMVYEARPRQCMLFPLVGFKPGLNLKNSYTFCKGLKGNELVDVCTNRKQLQKVSAYFENVKKNGFKKVWKSLPSKGVLLLEDERVCNLTSREFFQAFRQ